MSLKYINMNIFWMYTQACKCRLLNNAPPYVGQIDGARERETLSRSILDMTMIKHSGICSSD